MTHPPTHEQTAILDLLASTTSNLMINALAGTGKTATLELIEAASPTKPVLYLVFNTKNAKEAEGRMATTTTVRTFNSIGHRIWSKAIGRQFKPDARKVGDIYRAQISAAPANQRREMWNAYDSVIEGVSKAKALGYIPPAHSLAKKSLATAAQVLAAMEEVPDRGIDVIDQVLIESIRLAYSGTCDFNDQVYMPALFGGSFPEFPLVLVDEFQDLNPVNHAMVAKLAKHRLIGVGDPYQSIYEFRGAVPGGMHRAVRAFSMIECDLSVSFRCPRAIVEHVRHHVPNFKWYKAGGNVTVLEHLDGADLGAEATFICRNNAPLFRLAMRLLVGGHSVSVAGSDIGPRITRQMSKFGPEDLTRTQVLDRIANWEAERTARGSTTAADTAGCMRVFAEQGSNLGQAIAYADHLFKQTGRLTFTTGHKAKGLEWPVVFHLDSNLLREGDANLDYVISTRSADQLYYINSEDIHP